jgi:putative hemolysin
MTTGVSTLSSGGVVELIFLAVLIFLNAFFAASEIAIITVRKSRLRQLSEEGVQAAAIAERLANDSSRFLATIQVGVTLVGFFAAATSAVSLSAEVAAFLTRIGLPLRPQTSQAVAVFLITATLALVMLVLGELVPKSLALQYAEPIALFVARPIDLLATIASPIVRFPVFLTNTLTTVFGAQYRGGLPFITEEEIKIMVDAGEEGGVIEEDEKEMIYSIFEFGDTLVREVMVPRIDIVALEVNTPLRNALETIIAAGHSRIPVYEGTIDNIVGLLYAKDLLKVLRDLDLSRSMRPILRPAYFVPGTKKVDELLKELQQRKVHMAIVVDEYGGTAGLVTIEDILEEIVGEIQDEYDKEEPTVEVISPDEVIFSARVALDEVSEVMAVELPSEGGETLGGFIYSQLGRVPVAGDELTFDGLRIIVLQIDGRRIGKVKVMRQNATSEPYPAREVSNRDTVGAVSNSGSLNEPNPAG